VSACAECWACGQSRPLLLVGPGAAELVDGLERGDRICEECVARAVAAAGVILVSDLEQLANGAG
jgi:uncharacterized protein CbrC (UPF0167 family)